ncbi:MAG: hypothetical protein HY319_32745 [Armatimonadetes bacterium]|nr:hypothetical protein [Armatimonadota bacterium]
MSNQITTAANVCHLLEELSLAQDRRQFHTALARLARELAGAENAVFHEFDAAREKLSSPDQEEFALGENTLPGRCALYLEPVSSAGRYRESVPWDLDCPFPERLSGDSVPLEGWVLALAEHVDGFFTERRSLDFAQKLRLFFEEQSRLHHPTAVDALSGLADSGWLEKLYP